MFKRSSKLGNYGVILTILYFLSVLYFAFFTELVNPEPLSMNELGDFLAGVFGPPALVWVVISFYLQSEELKNSVNALNLQAKELNKSVEQQKAMVDVAREQMDMNIAENKQKILAQLTGDLPNFAYKSGSNSSSLKTKGKAFDFIFQNLGETAKSIQLNLSANEITLEKDRFHIVRKGENLKITVLTHDSIKFPEAVTTLEIASNNDQGKNRVQIFTIGNCEPEEISSSP